MIELNMIFSLGNLCVKIEIWDRNEKQFIETEALFDTGAHTTHVDTDTLRRLGYDLDNAEKSYINSIGKRGMQVKNIAIDNIKIGDLELGAVSVNFSELSDINSPAVILGMNIIKEFNIELDFTNRLISMKPNFDEQSAVSIDNFRKIDSRFGMWVMGAN